MSENGYLLAVPQTHQAEVIRLVHNPPFSGHLGINKTKQRIATQFYFPKLKPKIVQYIRSCHACQMVAPKCTAERQPLQPVQVLEKYPFQDISIDILGGDLPMTSRRNKYLLTIICNVSKFPHAIPLRNLKAETIAEALIQFFSLFGICKTIRMDQMPSFRSEILTALRNKLGIQAEFSAPYHCISHGTVERLNRTIEGILKKFLADHSRDWDQLINLLLFALRETPNESTKYSPAQLVFGRKLRGLMAVAREIWERGDPMEGRLKMSTLKYLEKLNQDIETALQAASDNVKEAQARMKANYDRAVTVRELAPNEQALILLPTEASKLTSAWRGPYQVLRRCENNNYELDLNGRRTIFHINQLRKYNPRVDDSAADPVSMIITESADDGELTDDDAGGSGQQGRQAASSKSANN